MTLVFIYYCKVKRLVSENGAVRVYRIFSVDKPLSNISLVEHAINISRLCMLQTAVMSALDVL